MSRLTASPNPVKVGEHLTVCYEFAPGQTGPIEVHVSFDCHGDPIDSAHSLVPREPCVTLLVPESALGGLVSDPREIEEDIAVTVLP